MEFKFADWPPSALVISDVGGDEYDLLFWGQCRRRWFVSGDHHTVTNDSFLVHWLLLRCCSSSTGGYEFSLCSVLW